VNLGPGDTLLINGISGTLGLGAALIALAMGVPRIFGTARDASRLAQVKALAPQRIEILTLGSRKIADWARQLTDGFGVDVLIDCLGPGSPPETMVEAIYAVRLGGKVLNVGGMGEIVPMDVHWMMDKQISFIGSCWFNTAEGQDMAAMAGAGTLDLSVFQHRCFSLSEINDALDGIQNRNGGFTNFVMVPSGASRASTQTS
jgi:threonine dehydrogenase-like Zn-dependent dehydrogenase